MSETCSACGHELPAGYVGHDGLCYLCEPLTDGELDVIANERHKRIERLFYAKLAERYPDHPWLKLQQAD